MPVRQEARAWSSMRCLVSQRGAQDWGCSWVWLCPHALGLGEATFGLRAGAAQQKGEGGK